MYSDGIFTFETLIAVLILFIYTISAPIFEKFKFHYIHESGLCIIIGLIITLIAQFSPEVTNSFKFFYKQQNSKLKFNSQFFFTFILPPMIFSAGYNLRRRTFFRYFLYIFIFGILGTLLTFAVVAPLSYLTNQAGFFKYTYINLNSTNNNTTRNLSIYSDNELNSQISFSSDNAISYDLNFSLSEILLFSSIISATDTVSALAFINDSNEPKLFSIMLGEGVLNDAVCIVLYKIIQSLSNSGKSKI